MEAYCVKCKAKKEMQNPEEVTLKNGRKALKGKCPDCGTTMCAMMSKEKAEKAIESGEAKKNF